MKPFKARGVRVHDPDIETWGLHKAADLPENPASVQQAIMADPDSPSEGPDIRNSLKKYGQNYNQTRGGPAYGG